MAQTIKLKRSATTGKVPSTSNLALGELAVNTYDGRIFFKKNDGSDSIEHIVTTDSITTGSITLTQTGSFGEIEIDSGGTNSELHLKASSNTHYRLTVGAGQFQIQDMADAITPILIDTSGKVGIRVNGAADAALHVHSETPSDGLLILSSDSGNLLEVNDTGLEVAGNISGSSFNGTGLLSGSISGQLPSGVISGSSQIDHDATTNFNANEHFTQANITTVGTIGTGTWQGSVIASAYLDSDTAHLSGTQTFSGTKTFTNETTHNGGIKLGNDDKVRWTSDDVYIAGTTSGDNLDFVVGGTSKFNISQTDIDMKIPVNVDDLTQSTSKTTGCMIIDGGVGIAKTLNVGEDVVAYASSDERYKDNVTPIENPNEKIKLLSGNTFVWNDKHEVFKGKKDIGVIAQEVEKVLPEIVETRDNGYKAVKYEKIVALLIESNKELLKRVEELESKIK